MTTSATQLSLPSRLFNLPRERIKAAEAIPFSVLHHGVTEDMKISIIRIALINLIFYTFVASKETPKWYIPEGNKVDIPLLKHSLCSNIEPQKKVSAAFESIFTAENSLNLDNLHILTLDNLVKQLQEEKTLTLPPSVFSTKRPSKKNILSTDKGHPYVEEVVLDRSSGKLVVKKKLLDTKNRPQKNYYMLDKCPKCELNSMAFVPLIPFHIQEKHFKGRDFTFPDFKEFCEKSENQAITELFMKTAIKPCVFIDSTTPDKKTGMVDAPDEATLSELAVTLGANILLYCSYSLQYCGYNTALFFLNVVNRIFGDKATENS
ncbi:hypothetical protein COB11_01520 [Candidatus Aerophobetes bacterium]|uniref:Uncharacterized protein n=1 Tax=Aerophobetes bacterium TaxID=2030807 RepID=A0A2A4YLJ0_UNCAE|nr:MAG: hypothetical protein COB11_01520 [Candidatus Aerophobetes bacterium]